MLIKQRDRLFDIKNPKGVKMAYVWGKGLGILADRNFKKGEVVIHFKAKVVSKSGASPESVKIDKNRYLDTKWLVPEAFINHSCSPNTKLDVVGYNYTAIKPIKKNDEITFNYLTTEWDLKDEAFECRCGSRNCYKVIRGLKYLSRIERIKLQPFLMPYLRKNNPKP